jgi:hypothetical protein
VLWASAGEVKNGAPSTRNRTPLLLLSRLLFWIDRLRRGENPRTTLGKSEVARIALVCAVVRFSQSPEPSIAFGMQPIQLRLHISERTFQPMLFCFGTIDCFVQDLVLRLQTPNLLGVVMGAGLNRLPFLQGQFDLHFDAPFPSLSPNHPRGFPSRGLVIPVLFRWDYLSLGRIQPHP